MTNETNMPQEFTHDVGFDVTEYLDEGGQGVVHAAKQKDVDRIVAVKIAKLPKGKTEQEPDARDDKRRDSLLREAKLIAGLEHPNILPVYNAGLVGNSVFCAMKKYSAPSWDQIIKKGARAIDLAILLEVANAIEFAHKRGVWHLDIKPENVIVDESDGVLNEVLLVDWGKAISRDNLEERTDKCRGTYPYGSPEDWNTKSPVPLGPYTDIYLLGATLFEIVTGLPPHRSRVDAAINDIQATDATGELLAIARKAMSTAPEERHKNIGEFKSDVLSYKESRGLAELAKNEHQKARQAEGRDYRPFEKARTLYEAAQEKKPGEKEYSDRLSEVRKEHATAAWRRKDYDLGLSVIDAHDPNHLEVRKKLRRSKLFREIKEKVAWYSMIAVIVVLTGAYWMVNESRKNEAIALAEVKELLKDNELLLIAEQAALSKERTARREAQEQGFMASINALEAESERMKAELSSARAKEEARLAKEANRAGRKEAYRAIMTAGSKRVEENALEDAERLADTVLDLESMPARVTPATPVIPPSRVQEFFRRADTLTNQARELFGEQAEAQIRRIDEIQSPWAGPSSGPPAESDPESDALNLRNRELGRLNYVCGNSRSTGDTGKPTEDVASSPPKSDALKLRSWEWGRLKYVCRSFRTTGDTGTPIEVVAFSPDGQYFLTSGWDGQLRFWDSDSSSELDNPLSLGRNAPNQFVFDAAFHGGRTHDYLAVGCNERNRYIRCWRAEKGTRNFRPFLPESDTGPFRGHEDAVVSVMFSGDGKRLLTSSYDGTARIWDVDTGLQVGQLEAHEGPVWQAVFAPATRRASDKRRVHQKLVTVGNDGLVVVWRDPSGEWNNETGRLYRDRYVLPGHWGPVYSASFSSNGQMVATAGEDRRIIVWKLDRLKQYGPGQEWHSTIEHVLLGHTAPVRSLNILRSDGLLLSSGDDHTIRIWNIESERMRKGLDDRRRPATDRCLHLFRGHSGYVRSCEQHPKKDLLLSGSHDKSARLWSYSVHGETLIHGGRVIRSHAGPLLTASFADDPQRIITAGLDRQAHVFRSTCSTEKDPAEKAAASGTDPDGDQRDSAAPDESEEDPCSAATTDWGFSLTEGHEFLIRHALFLQDGEQLLTSSVDNTVRLWDRSLGETRRLEGTGRAGSVAYSRVTQRIATGSDRTIFMVPPDEDYERRLVMPTEIARRTMNYGAVRGSESTKVWGVRLWKAVADPNDSNGQEEPEWFFGTLGEVTTLSFSDDGRYLFTGDANGRCMLWDVVNRALVWGLEDHHRRPGGVVFASHFLPDGRILTASREANREGTLTLWDARSGRRLRATDLLFDGNDWYGRTALESMAVSADGTLVAVAFSNGVARTWDTRQNRFTAIPEFPADKNVFAENLQRLMNRRRWTIEELAGRDSELSPETIQGMLDKTLEGEVSDFVGQLRKAIHDLDPDVQVSGLGRTLITHLAISPDDKLLSVVTSDDRTVRVYDFQEVIADEEEAKPLLELTIEESAMNIGSLSRMDGAAFDPSSDEEEFRLLTTGGNTARLWQLNTERASESPKNTWLEIQRFGPHSAVTSAAILPEGKWDVPPEWVGMIATGSWDGWVKLWDHRCKVVGKLRHEAGVNTVQFVEYEGETHLLTSCDDGIARLWKVADAMQGSAKRPRVKYAAEHGGRVTLAVAFARQTGEQEELVILTGHDDGTAIIWNAADATKLNTLTSRDKERRHSQAILCAALSNDGRLIVTGGEDNKAIVWLANSGQPARVRDIPSETGVSLSPQEPNKFIVLPHTAPVTAVAFSDDGSRILTGSEDAIARIWDTAARRELIPLKGHARAVTSVAFQPGPFASGQKRHILTGSLDGTAVLWGVDDWESNRPAESPNDGIDNINDP